MRAFRSPVLAVATLALVSAATPSFAGSPYYDAMGAPMSADQADMTYNGMMHPEMMTSQQGMMRSYRCSPDQKRTHITRKNCGATKGMY